LLLFLLTNFVTVFACQPIIYNSGCSVPFWKIYRDYRPNNISLSLFWTYSNQSSSSLLKHVSKEKSVGVAGRWFQHLTM